MPAIKSNILEILISLTLIYALLSIFVSILLEWYNHIKKNRAKLLRGTIEQMLRDPVNLHYGHLFYNHPMIDGMQGRANSRPPQYISSSMFADVLMDVIANQARHGQKLIAMKDGDGNITGYEAVDGIPKTLKDLFEKAMKDMSASPLKDLLTGMWEKADNDLNAMKPLIEGWFNDQMDRASGWYKTKQKNKLIFFGFVVAISLNVDSIHIIKVLSMDEGTRNQLVNISNTVADNYGQLSDDMKKDDAVLWNTLYSSVPDSLRHDTSMIKKYMDKVKDSVSLTYMQKADSVLGLAAGLNLPIGWGTDAAPASWFNGDGPANCTTLKSKQGLINYNQYRNKCHSFSNVCMYLLGIIISGFSLSFGAPFWFELLVKFVNIRRAGIKPENTTNNKRK